jgi:hypothetical protein
MRAMLGVEGRPSLLVEVDNLDNKDSFNFYVINGAWNGKFQNGYITVYGAPTGHFSDLTRYSILTQNQDRLRGDYQDVFNNFSNPDYVAPETKQFVAPDCWDDDIAF